MNPSNPGIRIFCADSRHVRSAQLLGLGIPNPQASGVELTLSEFMICEQYAYGLELYQRAIQQKKLSLHPYKISPMDDPLLRAVAHQSAYVVLEKLGQQTTKDAEQRAHNLIHGRKEPPPQPPGPPRMPIQKPPDDVLQQLLVSSKFQFGGHILNVFEQLNLKTVGDLIQKSPQDLLRCKNFGRKRLQFVEAMLQAYGLQLGIKKAISLQADVRSNVLPFRRKDQR